MWKKMGVKEFPRGNNLWGSPADPELTHQLLPLSASLSSQVCCPDKAQTKTHEDSEKLKDSRGDFLLSFFFFPLIGFWLISCETHEDSDWGVG